MHGKYFLIIGVSAICMALSASARASSGDSVTPDTTQFLDFDRDYSGYGIDPNRNPHNVQTRYENIFDEYLPVQPKEKSINEYASGNIDKNREQYRNELKALLESKHIPDTTLADFPTLQPPKNALQQYFDPTPVYYYYDYPSSLSNNYLSALAFDHALFADPQVEEGYAELAKARDTLLTRSHFNTASLTDVLTALKGKQVGGYATYLDAASNFYDQTYDPAIKGFTDLSQSASPWLKETAIYMLGRIELIRAQLGWDGESDPAGSMDTGQLVQAEKLLKTYLAAYPKGSYTISARNLLRRAAYLGGDKAAYNAAAKEALIQNFNDAKQDKSRISDFYQMVLEFYKHFSGNIDYAHDPAMTVSFGIVGDAVPPLDAAKALQTDPSRYNAFPGLEPLLEASVYYRNHRYEDTISTLENAPQHALSMNGKALLAQSYTMDGKPDKALAEWHDVQRTHNEPAVQFALAYIHANQQDYLGLLRDPGITDPGILAGFATYYASLKELEQAHYTDNIPAEAQKIVGLELIRRYLLTKQYAGFVKVFEQVAEPQLFKPAYNDAKRLAHDSNDMQALMDVANFLNANAFNPTTPLMQKKMEPYEGLVSVIEVPDTARCKPCRKSEDVMHSYERPYDYYQKIQQHFENNGQKNELEAEALHHLVECFHAGYRLDTCMWEKIEPNAGKAAFHRLHKLYPHSEWAKKTPYYYELEDWYYKPPIVPQPTP